MSVYKPKNHEVAGFELCGWKLPDGKIRLGLDKKSGTVVDSWPEEVFMCNDIYTLEKEEWQDNGFGWGFYV